MCIVMGVICNFAHVALQVRAILTGALTMSDGTTLNTATELNAFVYNTIAGWCD